MKHPHILVFSQHKIEKADWNCSGRWLASHNCLHAGPGPCWVLFPAPLAQRHSSPLEWGGRSWGERPVVGDGAGLGPTLMAIAPVPWGMALPQGGGGVGNWAEKLWLTAGSGSSMSDSCPNTCQVDRGRCTLRRDVICVHVRPSTPMKSTGNTLRLYRMFPHKDIHLRPRWGTFTSFYRDRKS